MASTIPAEVTFLLGEDTERRELLAAALSVPFEDAAPVRSFPSYRGQRNFPGLWWSAPSGRHVGFESWLERDSAMMLDFDPRVVGYAAQPFRLSWWQGGQRRVHVPDFFARLDDGTGVVVDCRPEDRRPAEDAEKFSVTERLCVGVGWCYQLVTDLDPVLAGNVRWLAGYRHPRNHAAGVVDRLLEVFTRRAPLLAGAERVGDPVAVLPALFHLLWQRWLDVELDRAAAHRRVRVPGGGVMVVIPAGVLRVGTRCGSTAPRTPPRACWSMHQPIRATASACPS